MIYFGNQHNITYDFIKPSKREIFVFLKKNKNFTLGGFVYDVYFNKCKVLYNAFGKTKVNWAKRKYIRQDESMFGKTKVNSARPK